MSLYDGLDIENNDSSNAPPAADVAAWPSSYKMLQSQLQVKKASSVPSKKNRSSGRLAPVVDLKKTIESDFGLHFDHITGKLQRKTAVEKVSPHDLSTQALPFISPGPGPSLTGAVEEYDPLRPNEYDEILKVRRDEKERNIAEDKQRQADDDRKKRLERDHERMNEDNDGRVRDRSDDRDMERARRRREEEEEEEYERSSSMRVGSGTGAAIAPPQALIEGDNPGANNGRVDVPPPQGGSVASKIMAKYGYRHGQGLGKSEQGMSIALQIEKTSKRGGKIIHERDLIKANTEAQSQSNTNLLKNPSKVILLLNMVGPGEVDEDLEPETAEECGKYGKVIKCVVFEIPDTPDDAAVRLFIEFERLESAIKALVDLNGRYFGGRAVRACFYNLDKFRRMDYSEEAL